jgi:hypothetical protein
MRTFKLKVREVSEVVHIVHVPDHFRPYPEEALNDWANEIGEQDSKPVETLDVQVKEVLEAEEVKIN